MSGTGWISVTEAAQILYVSPNTVRKRILDGQLPAVRAGHRQYRLREEHVRAAAREASHD